MSQLNLAFSLALGVMAVPVAVAHESPQGGVVVAGSASIASQSDSTTITQTTAQAVLEWQSFDIGASQAVRFIQPDSNAVALNRVLGADPSRILGSLSSNGKVFLVNPNGILFGQGAAVNVGGLVASSRNISNSDFMAGKLLFNGAGTGEVINRGAIDAGSGYVAMLGAKVSNNGVIAARLGSVALAAGNAFTLDVAGDGLLSVAVNAGAVNALVENGGLIRADGGQVLLAARSAGDLLTSAVNNGGIIQAQTIENRQGIIRLLGDMQSGTVHVSGLLDASAPQGGDGGLVDTSAATVSLAPTSRVTTSAPAGATGHWVIDPADFTIAASGGDITGALLSAGLANSNVTIYSTAGAAGTNGDIRVNDTVSWSANLLTLNAIRNIDINTAMQGAGTASLALQYGQGAVAAGNAAAVNVRAAVNLPSGNNFSTRLGSDGSIVTYTVINDMTALQNVNGNLAGNYALGSNLDAAGVTGFQPLGPMTSYNGPNKFEGRLDGLGHSISNLTLSRPGGNYVGLFGAVGGNSLVNNLGLVNMNVTGGSAVGGLVGMLFGSVSNSYATGTVSGSDLVGGLIGYVDVGRVTGSYANVAVSAGPNYDYAAGGLVGSSYVGTIRDSYAAGSVTGSYVGGITGVNNGGLVENSYSSALVSLSLYGNSPGGLVGREYNGGTVVNSYWNTTRSGQSGSVGGTGLTTAQLQAALPTGLSPERWGNGGNRTTPYLIGTSAPVLISADTSNTYYNVVQNVDALQGMSGNLAGNYVVVNDIDAAPTRGWNGGLGFRPVGDASTPFTGRLNGLGYSIDGLYINRPATSVVGLFGQVSGSGRVQRAGLTNLAITGSNQVGGWMGIGITGYFANLSVTGTVAGQNSVGGLIGYNNSSQVYDSRTATAVTGNNNVGGLIGETNGGVPTSRNYATGSVTALGDNVGGLVGYNGFSYLITDSYATGSVAGVGNVGGLVGYHLNGNINTSYSTGTVAGVSNVGGLVGAAGSGSTYSSFWNSETSGQASSARGTGLTSAQMQQRSNFGGWNFSSSWVSYDGHASPLLRSFMTPLTVTAQDVMRTYDGLAYSGTPTAVYSLTPDPSRISGTLDINVSGTQAGYSPISVSGLWSDQNGYAIDFIAGQHIINPYTVSLAGTRVYDGTEDVAADAFAIGTLVNGETLTLTGSGIAERNVGAHTVDLNTLELQDGSGSASNYTLYGGTHAVDITAADITFGASDVIRVYDGSTNAAGPAVLLAGTLFGGDSMMGGSFAFTDRNAGTGKTVTTSGVSVDDGNGGANYRVTYADNTTSTITRAQLGATAVAADKIYDGSTLASATLAISGLVGGETLAVSNLASFNSKDVATANLVTVDSITLADGSGGGLAANYTLAAGQTAAASITPRALGVAGQTALSKEYDGTRLAHATFTLTGLVDGETLAVSNLASFNSEDVATANLVTVDSIALADGGGGGLAANYTLTAGQTAAAAISPRALVVVGQSAQTKTYDGTNAATLSGGSLAGVIQGEVVTLTETGRFVSAEPGNAIAVTAANTLGAPDAVNYSVIQPIGLTAAINPLPVAEVPVVDVRTAANYQGALTQASGVSGTTAPPPYAPLALQAARFEAGSPADPFDLAGLNLRVVSDENEDRRR